MALAIAARSELSLHIFHDERSASFAALGIGMASKESGAIPAILLCTSGTAAVEFHAAVVEAHHASVPMLVCTADRPPELRGVGAPQTIDQQNLYGVASRLFVDAGVPDDAEQLSWRSLAQQLVKATVGNNPGPVHLNLPFREPLVGEAHLLPPTIMALHLNSAFTQRVIDRELLQLFAKACAHQNGVILAGSGIDVPQAVFELAHQLQWPVVADARSGCRLSDGNTFDATVVSYSDILLRDARTASQLVPSVVLRFGEPPVSKVVNTWIRESGCLYFAVSETPQLKDPDRIVTAHIVAKTSRVCAQLLELLGDSKAGAGVDPWVARWARAQATCASVLENMWNSSSELSEPLVARTVVDVLPNQSNLVLSSSMPVRDVEWFGAPRIGLRVLANRGVNGIDGVVSTAVGVALASHRTTTLLIGDIAFLHDTNGMLNLMDRNADLKIVVVDNKGGGIFSFLPQSATLDPQRFEQLFGTPHNVNIELLVRAHGIACTIVSTVAELRDGLVQLGSRVLIVNTNRKRNVIDHDLVYGAVAQALTGE